eukprot:COSAG02_NODE_836_length_16647_cov_17.589014_8_plen_64_part_00
MLQQGDGRIAPGHPPPGGSLARGQGLRARVARPAALATYPPRLPTSLCTVQEYIIPPDPRGRT